jgi:hypothetical protein
MADLEARMFGNGPALPTDAYKVLYKDMGNGTYALVTYGGAGGGGGGAATIADGADATQGSKTDAMWDGVSANPTQVALEKRIAFEMMKTDPVPITGPAFRSKVTTVRPNDTTAYAANDVIGGPIALGVIGRDAGIILINGSSIRIDEAVPPAWAAGPLQMHFYTSTPPSAIADNGAWTLAAADWSVYAGFIDLGTPVDRGPAQYAQGKDTLQIQLTGTSLWAYLVSTVGGASLALSSLTTEVHAIAL